MRNRYHNTGGEVPQFNEGDLILERNETKKDSLDRKFYDPYKEIDVGTPASRSKRVENASGYTQAAANGFRKIATPLTLPN